MANRTWADNTSVLAGFGGTIDSTDSLYVGVGGAKPSSTLDQSAKDVAAIYVGEDSETRFGNETDGDFVIVVDNTNTGRVVFAGGADWHVGANAGEHFRTTISSPKGASYYMANGTWTHLEVMVGFARVQATAIVVNLYQNGGNSYLSYNATAVTAGRINAGTCRSHRVFTTCNIGAVGRVEQGEKDQTWATVSLDGGRFVPKGGTITQLNLRAGVLDCSKLQAGLTITNAELWEGAEIINPPGQGSGAGIFITWTNAPTIRGRSVKGYMKTN